MERAHVGWTLVERCEFVLHVWGNRHDGDDAEL